MPDQHLCNTNPVAAPKLAQGQHASSAHLIHCHQVELQGIHGCDETLHCLCHRSSLRVPRPVDAQCLAYKVSCITSLPSTCCRTLPDLSQLARPPTSALTCALLLPAILSAPAVLQPVGTACCTLT
jgi:hypothetical protein